jgi:pimeloyl-ACP methyl ester carboxylesterase
VRSALAALGHESFTPSLTGLGDRNHLLSPAIDLETHIDDVANLILWEELSDVVLCGHSYGGCVITGVADRVGHKIKALVYLDALVLNDGESAYDAGPPEYRARHLEAARPRGDGWRIPPAQAEFFNVNPADRAWVDRLSTPHPMATFQQPLRLKSLSAKAHDTTYILATGWALSALRLSHYERAKARSWRTREVACGSRCNGGYARSTGDGTIERRR